MAWLATFSGAAPMWYRLHARKAVRILAYHGIADEPDNPFTVSVTDFRDQIAHLKANCRVISLDQVADGGRGGDGPAEDRVVLTFDDGYRNFFTNAFPILQAAGLPATCFVIAGQLDGCDSRFLREPELAEMLESGLITVASHGYSHRSMAELPAEERRLEAERSKQVLEQRLGVPIRFFCYPYGTFNDFDGGCEQVLRDAGYELAVTSINGVNTVDRPHFRFRRTKIEGSDNLVTFSRLLRGGLDAWIIVDYFLRFLQRRREFSLVGSAFGPSGGTE